MFRPRFTIALAIVASSLLAWRLPAQQAGGLEYRADALAAAAGNKRVEKYVIPGAADLIVGYRLLGTSETRTAGVDARPSVAFVVSPSADVSSSWSEAAWLSIFESLLALSPGDGLAGIYLCAVKATPATVTAVPGDPLLRGSTLREALSDLGVPAVILLDFDGPPAGLTIRAASRRAMSPRRVLMAARAAASASGTDSRENPVADFYAAAGLAEGCAMLGPWLQSGVPALVIANRPGSMPDSGPAGLGGFALAFVEAIGRTPPVGPGGDDVNYLRYPLPAGVLTLGDGTIVAATMASLAIIAVAAASGLLSGRRRRASLRAVAREAITALAMAFVAFAGARLLSDIATAALRGYVDTVTTSGTVESWFNVISLATHLAGALCWFYAASGLVAVLGLHGDHGRIDAAMGSLGLLCVELAVVIGVFPPAAPFFIAAIAFVAFSSETAVTAGLGLLAAALVALPLADPRVLADFGSRSGSYANVASRLLGVGFRGTTIMAAISAPFGLWLVAAASPVARLRRGRSTAPVWIVGAVACAATEAVLRLAFGTS
jgi:hypothetical protein